MVAVPSFWIGSRISKEGAMTPGSGVAAGAAVVGTAVAGAAVAGTVGEGTVCLTGCAKGAAHAEGTDASARMPMRAIAMMYLGQRFPFFMIPLLSAASNGQKRRRRRISRAARSQ